MKRGGLRGLESALSGQRKRENRTYSVSADVKMVQEAGKQASLAVDVKASRKRGPPKKSKKSGLLSANDQPLDTVGPM